MSEREPWEQREGESEAAYKRFLAYRNLGPGRSIEAAYAATSHGTKGSGKQAEKAAKSSKKQQVSGQWYSDSRNHRWVARANAWDIHNMQQAGREVVLNLITALKLVAEKTVKALDHAQPTNWSEVISGINALGTFVSADAVAAVANGAGRDSAGDSAAAGGDE